MNRIGGGEKEYSKLNNNILVLEGIHTDPPLLSPDVSSFMINEDNTEILSIKLLFYCNIAAAPQI